MDKKFDIEGFDVNTGSFCYSTQFVGSQTGSVTASGDIDCEGASTLDSTSINTTALPTSDPSVMGRLWSNAGTMSVSSDDRFYSQGDSYIDLDAAMTHIEGATSGYVEWKQDKTTLKKPTGAQKLYSIFRLNAAATDRLVFDYDFPSRMKIIAISGGNTISAFAPYVEGQVTVKFEFSASGTALYYDGVRQTLDYETGDSTTPFSIPTPLLACVFADGVEGFYYDLKIADSGGVVVDYSSVARADLVFTESIVAAHGTYEEYQYDVNFSGVLGLPQIDKLGYNTIPYWSISRYIDYNKSPFLSVTLPDDSDDYTRAMLVYAKTQRPYIPEIESGAAYPTWTSVEPTQLQRNPYCWYGEKAITCFSVWSNIFDFGASATLLSKRHAVVAAHVIDPGQLGTYRIAFMDLDSNIQEVGVTAVKYLDSAWGSTGSDVAVILLDADITLDVDYATFMTASDFSAFDYKQVDGVGLCKEGYFCIENMWQGMSMGIDGEIYFLQNLVTYDEIIASIDDPKLEFSRYNTRFPDFVRDGDSSRPCFIYHGTTLYFMFTTTSTLHFLYNNTGGTVACKMNKGFNSIKTDLKTMMDTLDNENGGLPHYALVEKAI